ncbi:MULTISPECIES: ABC transporter ATP-binding protein [Paenibacillus]|uniref:Teichoic acid ABC transporter ATP-binding protein n=1 Tax=Paenibacillus ihbetae TaxID=1870820 RepID=A0A1B2E2G3_9BACL|nr:ABC transporter ATP-binding protein [Paenibacillus ihbetae]ANY74131.1 teichoic acid ABC transporter ATP-binding protein [Paenibacillus ihbetae]
MSEYAVEVNDVSMLFNLSTEKIDSLKEYVLKLLKKELYFKEFQALQNISFTVKKGDTFGLVGLNGAGKSTLLKIIAGVLKPTKGSVVVNGNLAPLIELGAGFNFDLSAKENIFLNGAVLGHSRAFMEEHYHSIVEFSELKDFIDVPIKNYSSGMVARLAFSVATTIKPEILIVDEVLAVGDYKFQEKCKKKMNELLDDGTTVLFVSHSSAQVKEMCNNAIWIEKGKTKMVGRADTVINAYEMA